MCLPLLLFYMGEMCKQSIHIYVWLYFSNFSQFLLFLDKMPFFMNHWNFTCHLKLVLLSAILYLNHWSYSRHCSILLINKNQFCKAEVTRLFSICFQIWRILSHLQSKQLWGILSLCVINWTYLGSYFGSSMALSALKNRVYQGSSGSCYFRYEIIQVYFYALQLRNYLTTFFSVFSWSFPGYQIKVLVGLKFRLESWTLSATW